MNKSNIVLTGFMGVGKTKVGKRLAKLLEMDFVDTDQAIEVALGMKISEIFCRYGEERFRDEETAVICQASAQHNCVIATGGGAVLNQDNSKILREKGIIILLTAEPSVIASRVIKTGGRPLLQENDPHNDLDNRIRDLLLVREPYYQNCDYRVDTSERSIDKVAKKIISLLDVYRESGGGWNIGNTTG